MSYLTYFTLIVKEDPNEQKGQLINDAVEKEVYLIVNN